MSIGITLLIFWKGFVCSSKLYNYFRLWLWLPVFSLKAVFLMIMAYTVVHLAVQIFFRFFFPRHGIVNNGGNLTLFHICPPRITLGASTWSVYLLGKKWSNKKPVFISMKLAGRNTKWDYHLVWRRAPPKCDTHRRNKMLTPFLDE